MRSLIAGATGFVGSRLARSLLDDGLEVRAIARDAAADAGLASSGAEVAEADLLAGDELEPVVAGCDVAYFLVHMMGRVDDWPRREAGAARRFAEAAKAEGVDRVIYLGGLDDESRSEHLASRHATALALREAGPPLTYIRAAMIVGAGSESYDLLRSIVERLPAIPSPDWLHSRTQPIGIRDVVAYLRRAPGIPETEGREIQIGGPDVLTHLDVVDAMARELGRRPKRRLDVPGATPEAVAAAAAAVTDGDGDVAEAIAAGLPGDTVVTDRSGMALFDIKPESLSVALQRAIEAEEVAA